MGSKVSTVVLCRRLLRRVGVFLIFCYRDSEQIVVVVSDG